MNYFMFWIFILECEKREFMKKDVFYFLYFLICIQFYFKKLSCFVDPNEWPYSSEFSVQHKKKTVSYLKFAKIFKTRKNLSSQKKRLTFSHSLSLSRWETLEISICLRLKRGPVECYQKGIDSILSFNGALAPPSYILHRMRGKLQTALKGYFFGEI